MFLDLLYLNSKNLCCVVNRHMALYSPNITGYKLLIFLDIGVYQFFFRWIGGCILARVSPNPANYPHRPAPPSTTNINRSHLYLYWSYWYWIDINIDIDTGQIYHKLFIPTQLTIEYIDIDPLVQSTWLISIISDQKWQKLYNWPFQPVLLFWHHLIDGYSKVVKFTSALYIAYFKIAW